MPPQPAQNFLPPAVAKLLLEFFWGDISAEFKPNLVQKVDFLGREARSMRAQIEDVLLPVGKIDLQHQLWFRGRQALPCQARNTSLFRNRTRGRRPENNRG